MMVEALIVDPAYRRRGIGSALVRAAENLARQRGSFTVESGAEFRRQDSPEFWERLGYDCEAYRFRRAVSAAAG